MAYTVTSNRIVVRVHEPEKKSDFGLILAGDDAALPAQAEVLAVGPGRKNNGDRVPVDLTVGDKVIYTKGTGIPLKFDGQEVLILTEDDVIGTVSSWIQ